MKGAQYRLPKLANRAQVIDAVNTCAMEFAKKHARKTKQQIIMYNHFLLHVNNVITKITKNMPTHKSTIEELYFRKSVKDLQQKYVIAPSDKCANNYVIICKRFYVEMICRELGVEIINNRACETPSGNTVYQIEPRTKDQLINLHVSTSTSFGILVPNEHRYLPGIFALPKMHKEPPKFRFIAAASKCSTKNLSILLHNILVFLKNHFRNYCNAMRNHGQPNGFWIIDNSLSAIEKLRLCENIDSAAAYDFSTLYTELPHNEIQLALQRLINLCFKNAGKTYLNVGYEKCWFSHELGGNYSLRETDVYALLNHIIANTFIEFAGFIFRQTQGVSMGGNASPDIANLTLAMKEFEFCKTADRSKANQLRKAVLCRYIDDIFVANCDQFIQWKTQIYGASLKLEPSKVKDKRVPSLDTKIAIGPLKDRIHVYDKTNDFDFPVIKYGFADSNVQYKNGLDVLQTQIIRFARISNSYEDFKQRLVEISYTMVKHGYKNTDVALSLGKLYGKYPNLFHKYGIQSARNFVALTYDTILRN
jgi:hypothetical protein